jgi:hypothetical protein
LDLLADDYDPERFDALRVTTGRCRASGFE